MKVRGVLKWPFRLLSGLLAPVIKAPPAKNVFREKPCTRLPKPRRAA
ncbi:MAG: hypothetical protein QM775_02270 [Pirellulales bacterium]